jgi:hypothetical protein
MSFAEAFAIQRRETDLDRLLALIPARYRGWDKNEVHFDLLANLGIGKATNIVARLILLGAPHPKKAKPHFESSEKTIREINFNASIDLDVILLWLVRRKNNKKPGFRP